MLMAAGDEPTLDDCLVCRGRGLFSIAAVQQEQDEEVRGSGGIGLGQIWFMMSLSLHRPPVDPDQNHVSGDTP